MAHFSPGSDPRDRSLSRSDSEYPARLRAVADAPESLFIRGKIPSRSPVVALVGSRAASGAAMKRAHGLAKELSSCGALVISGGALGVDTAAHLGALAASAPTAVVLGTSLDNPYPSRNLPLFGDVVRGGGALVTPFPMGSPVLRWQFPRRNRVIAGMADIVVVVEASPKSGALYTAQAASDYGRTICACPGSPGADALLAQGASVAETADDVVSALAGRSRAREAPVLEAGSEAARVLSAVDPTLPRSVESISATAGVASVRTASVLFHLEVDGLVFAVPGGRYVRSSLGSRTITM
ncbi:MAG: DNA-protecting protein DprA [Deltaproteobacteria bacterium]|nr:DNA-protecting protein DprA [Deltaproteobacteria bacterium]